MKVLVTGAAGSIGAALVVQLRADGHDVVATDLHSAGACDGTRLVPLDVRSWERLFPFVINEVQPDLIYHLAGAKHAPEGEEDPWSVTGTNVDGTGYVLQVAERVGAKVVVASTCKACDPETVYGASKLIAERMTLNAGQVVVRYYNVRDTVGNVFRLWESIPEDEPIPYTVCLRYFITLRQALHLTTRAAQLPSGRYTVDPGRSVYMRDEAKRLYPGRELVLIPRRRGDRVAEPDVAACERMEPVEDGLFRIVSAHDPVREEALV